MLGMGSGNNILIVKKSKKQAFTNLGFPIAAFLASLDTNKILIQLINQLKYGSNPPLVSKVL